MLKINKSEISSKIKQLKSVMPPKSAGGIEGFLIKDNMMIADNFEYTLATPLVCSDTFVLPKTAVDLIESFPDGEITINPTDKDIAIESSAGKSRFSAVDPSTFIVSNPITFDECEECHFSACSISEYLSHVAYACAKDNSVYGGILLESDGQYFNFVALDGYRLAWDKLKSDEKLQAVIPSSAASKFISLGIDGSVTVKVSKNHIGIITEDYIISTKQMKGDFLNYKSTVPKGIISKFTVDRAELIATLNRAIICSSGLDKKNLVILQTEGDVLTVSVNTAASSFEGEMKISDKRGTYEGIKIGLNSKYMLDALKSYSEDKVSVTYNGPTSPLLINGSSLTSLVLPVKIK